MRNYRASTGRQIANAQIFFNVIGVTLVLPFLPAIARGLQRLISDARAPSTAVEMHDGQVPQR